MLQEKTGLHEALAHIKGLLLFSLQAEPTVNITDQLQDVLQREKNALKLWKFSAGVSMHH